MNRPVRFLRRPRITAVARAAAMTAALSAVFSPVRAGPGFADATMQNGSTSRIQTYFAYTPWGVRATPVDEALNTLRFPNLTGDPQNTGRPLRKFVDPLPLPGAANAKLMADGATSKYIPVAVPTKWINPGSGAATGDDYYEIGLVEYADRFHSDLRKATTLRGYVQIDHLASSDLGSVPGSKRLFLYYPNSSGQVSFASTADAPSDAQPVMIAATNLKGFRTGTLVHARVVDAPHFLGPVIAATKDIPTRMKFLNLLPAGRAEIDPSGTVMKDTLDVSGNPVQFPMYKVTRRNGDLPLPVDKSLIGAGVGPDGITEYTQNRAQIHLHGGDTPWISDGTPHQWITPMSETDPSLMAADGRPLSLAAKFADPTLGLDPSYLPEYLRGASAANVPDMPDPGAGAVTYYYPNGQTARMMWYHDHSLATTRLNVYAGMASAYLLTDSTEQGLISNGTLPPAERTIPLVLQDRTFVPDDIALQDERWNTTAWGAPGDSWMPHVYETVQDPNQVNSWNAVGRWHYGPWFWPVFPSLYPLPLGVYSPEGAENTNTTTPEAWMDTPVINGVAYPVLEVDPKTYRFKILNASNDRMFTFSFFKSKTLATLADGSTVENTEVKDAAGNAIPSELDMVPASISSSTCAAGVTRPQLVGSTWCQPDFWPTDNRDGGMPAPSAVGPTIYQIGSEGGFLPKPVTIEPSPITYLQDKGRQTVLNVNTRSLFLAPAERADIVVDFSPYAGQTLIVYNDSGAPIPASDPRNETFTGYTDQSGSGGTETTKPGYGPNIRTMMLVRVKATAPDAPLNTASLNSNITAAYVASQERPVVAQPAYAAFDATWASIAPVATTAGQPAAYASIYTATLKQPTFEFVPGRPDKAINGVNVDVSGAGYVTAPAVTISPPAAAGGKAATAQATMKVDKFIVTAAGSGYTTAPLFTITGGGGNGATGTANLGIDKVNVTNGGSGYTSAPTVNFSAPQIAGGTKPVATAVVSAGKVTAINVSTRGTGYTAAPLVSITGGGGTGAKGASSGYVNTVAVDIPDPMNATSAGGGGYVNFDANNVADPLTTVTYTFTGGNGSGAAATATGKVFNISLTSPGFGYAAADNPVVTVGAAPAGGTNAKASANKTQSSYLVKNKGIQELFDPTYGRLNATFSVELPFTSSLTQTTIPLAYVDEPTEQFSDNETQIWKITHNGVDTHPVHFHLLNVQVINRVGWDGFITPPNDNELGWKETVRMSPLEDIIVAVKARRPTLNGFGLPSTIRLMDPSQPIGAPYGFTQIDPKTGLAKTVTNDFHNYGWEYVWHCHILGHEENDFMRPWAFDPKDLISTAPTGVSAVAGPFTATVYWTDPTPFKQVSAASPALLDAKAEVGFRVERSVNNGAWVPVETGLTGVPGLIVPGSGLPGVMAQVNTLANATTFSDESPVEGAVAAPPVATTAPTTPAVGTTSVTVRWTTTATSIASSFGVWRTPVDPLTHAATGPAVQVGTVVNAPPACTVGGANVTCNFTDTTAQPGASYTYHVDATGGVSVRYRVQAVNSQGAAPSAASNPVGVPGTSFTVTSAEGAQANALPLPPTVTGTGVLLSSATSATLNWNAATGAARYQVRYCQMTTTNGTCTMGAWNAVPSGTAFVASGLTATRWVRFEVQSVSAAGVPSASVFAPSQTTGVHLAAPARPTVTVGTLSTTAIPLTFAATDATGFQIKVASTSADLAVAPWQAVAGTAFTIVGTANTQWFYQVQALNNGLAGTASAAANRYTLPEVPGNVVGVNGVAGGTVNAGLSWTAPVGGAATYQVRSANNAAMTGATGWTTATSGQLVTQTAGARYMQVRAVTAGGQASAASQAVAVTAQ